jgi:hypothetical protein
MEVNNGAVQTVRYFGSGLSPRESNNLRQIEQLENELAYARSLQDLKLQYVSDERFLQPYRTSVQRELYGLNIERSYSTAFFGGLGLGRGLGFSGAGLSPYGYAYGPGLYGGLFGGGATTTVDASLANGVGDEGAIKSALAGTLARQATPEYMASLDRDLERATVRASTSPALRAALDLPPATDLRRERARETPLVEYEQPSGPIVLTLKDGERVAGKKMERKGGWIILHRMNGRILEVRESEVVSIDREAGIGR